MRTWIACLTRGRACQLPIGFLGIYPIYIPASGPRRAFPESPFVSSARSVSETYRQSEKLTGFNIQRTVFRRFCTVRGEGLFMIIFRFQSRLIVYRDTLANIGSNTGFLSFFDKICTILSLGFFGLIFITGIFTKTHIFTKPPKYRHWVPDRVILIPHTTVNQTYSGYCFQMNSSRMIFCKYFLIVEKRTIIFPKMV